MRSLWASLKLTERAFVGCAVLMAALFARFDTDFAKLGVPLPIPGSLGGLPGQEPKLFMMELFLGFCFVLFYLHGILHRAWKGPAFRDPVWLCLCGVFLFGLARLAMDLPSTTNTLLAARNSCFVWYLALPLAAYHSGISLAAFRWLAGALAAVLAGLFLVGVVGDFALHARPAVQWFLPGGGVVGLLLVAFMGRSWRFFWWLLPFCALALASVAYSPINRTTVIAQGAAFALAFLVSRHKWERARIFGIRAALLVALALPLTFLWGARIVAYNPSPKWPLTKDPLPIERQLFHGEVNSGVESYRWEMWKDAWTLFLSNPLTGVGFEKQVVHRLYEGFGNFKANDTETMKGPPVSGPHNSYLNALARMGVAGSAFLLLHLLCGFALWRAQEKTAFWLFWSQTIYAILNVALEGPVRSLVLLLFTGMALKISAERRPVFPRAKSEESPRGAGVKNPEPYSPEPLGRALATAMQDPASRSRLK